jgi:trehalose synthase
MSLREVELAPLAPQRFAEVLAAEPLARFEQAIAGGRALMDGRTLWTVNSTARGGGVAEMLRSLIGYVRGAGLDARWVVAGGDPEFFAVTKRLHNRLHGADDGTPLGARERAIYDRTCTGHAEELAARLGARDIVLLHDPQTAGMIPRLAAAGIPVIWRAHVGLDMPNALARDAWHFLTPYVEHADAVVFSRPSYAWDGLDPTRIAVIAPSIDAFSPKNQAMSFSGVTAVLRAAGLAADHHHASRAVFERLDGTVGTVTRAAGLVEEHALRLDTPLVAQISRWDRLKDPLGVLAAFVDHVRLEEAPHLLLAGPDVTAVADDPEGAAVLQEVEAAWRELPRPARRRVHLAMLPMVDVDENAIIVNALQRRADVIVQKSLAEGFGLTVAEAMWKGRPVVASAVGGIQDQIEDGRTGHLVAPGDLAGFGARVTALLADPHGAERMGAAAQRSVRDNFLGARHLGQWVELLGRVLHARADAGGFYGSPRAARADAAPRSET